MEVPAQKPSASKMDNQADQVVVARTYAGIGSQETPEPILLLMRRIAAKLYRQGWHLNSGGARGADMAFWHGYVNDAHGTGRGTIYRPEDATPEAIAHAAKYHPNWQRCNLKARKLHGRNSMIVLGPALNAPVKMIVCWTPGARVVGGTGQALRIAEAYDIPVRNLGKGETLKSIQHWLRRVA